MRDLLVSQGYISVKTPLIFDKKAQAWTVSKNAIFKLKIKKSVGGVSAIKLPDKLISWLLNTFLPKVIKDAIISSLPIQIGDLVQDDITTIELSGSINIKNDLPISVWQAKLHKDTSLAKFARSKLGVTKDEAEIKAKKIWENYCEQHKERDDKRELEHQRRWNEALEWESYNTLFEHADNYDLDD